MTNKIKTIVERIREYYCSGDNNEWLVEKGKVKEGRLLKESCIEIERYVKLYDDLNRKYNSLYYEKLIDKDKITQPYKDSIYKLKSEIESLYETIKHINLKSKDILNLTDIK